MRNKKLKKALACTLTLAVAFSAVPNARSLCAEKSDLNLRVVADSQVTADTIGATASGSAVSGSAVSGSADSVEIPVTDAEKAEIRQVLKENHEMIYKLSDDQQILISHKVLKTDPYEIAEVIAGAYVAAGEKEISYACLDDGKSDELLLILKQKKELVSMRVYDGLYSGDAKFLDTYLNVTEVRNSKKDREIVIKQKKGKKVTYTTGKATTKGLKVKVTYSQKGKKYKKNNKKISKKKFKKYEKSYKKLKKTAFNKDVDPKNVTAYKEVGAYHYADGVFWSKEYTKTGYDTFVMKAGTDASDPDQYRVLWMSDEDLTRYILAPNVLKPGTKETYQKAQFDTIVKNEMDYSLLPHYQDIENGSSEYELYKILDNATSNTPDGENPYTIKRFYFKRGDTAVSFEVFRDGPMKGMIDSIYIGLSSDMKVNQLWDFKYGKYANYDGDLFDPTGFERAYAYPDYLSRTNKSTRSLTIQYEGTNPDIKSWTVTATADVLLDFAYITSDGVRKTDFYFKNGSETTSVPVSPDEKGFDEFHSKLNVEDENCNYSTDESLANNIFWKEG